MNKITRLPGFTIKRNFTIYILILQLPNDDVQLLVTISLESRFCRVHKPCEAVISTFRKILIG